MMNDVGRDLFVGKKQFNWTDFIIFFLLGVGGIFGAMEFWQADIINTLVGTFGTVEMTAHNIATQINRLAFMIPHGIAIALSVRLGSTLATNPKAARSLALTVFCVCALIFFLTSKMIYDFRRSIFYAFTEDPEILEVCVKYLRCYLRCYMSAFHLY